MTKDILSLLPDELAGELTSLGEQKFRAKQIFGWLHGKKTTEFAEMLNLSVQLRHKLTENFCIKSLNIKKRLVSSTDDTVKYLYALPDGEQVETVLMRYKHGNSLCISTQVGCKMGCAFCASGIAGFVRSLTPAEMLLQIYETERDSTRPVDSIVLMGIGEPLDNFDNVVKFLRLLSHPDGRGMSLRHVSLSTCGLADEIRELAGLRLGLTLSVSLHASDDETRGRLMPVNKRYPIGELLAACRYYFKETGRRISFEFALISGVNDGEDCAHALAVRLRGMPCHVNLIPVNPVKESGFRKSHELAAFQKILTDYGISTTVRRTLGSDIEAACGQLRREHGS